jgi:hypothetical protein
MIGKPNHAFSRINFSASLKRVTYIKEAQTKRKKKEISSPEADFRWFPSVKRVKLLQLEA